MGVITLASSYVQPVAAKETAPQSRAAEFRIRHHEPLNSFRFIEPGLTKKLRGAGQTLTWTVALQAFGKQFNLELTPNDQLLANLPTAQKTQLKRAMQIYKGTIAGKAGSWVRINRTGTRISGAFWDGQELYVIDSSDAVSKAIAGGQVVKTAGKAYPLIYKLSDTESDSTCAGDSKTKAFNNFKGLVTELQTRAKALPATRTLNIAIVTDAQFTKINSANPQAAVVARMNVVDGIYSTQVGVHINISEIRVLTDDGSLTATASEALLRQFSGFVSLPGFNNPGLAHLFTGRDIDGTTVGIAFMGGLCHKNYGVGLSQIGATGTAGALTVAHEMGHNFGAPHDSQGGCAGTPGTFIMNGILNGSNQFSACSLQYMTPVIARAACITSKVNTPTADVRPAFPVNPINATVSKNFIYRVEVRNGGTAAAQGGTAQISIPTGLTVSTVTTNIGTCTRIVGKVSCKLGTLAPSAVRTMTLNLKAGIKPAKLISTVLVGSSNDSNAANNIGKVGITVR
jgi:hypothetical protein